MRGQRDAVAHGDHLRIGEPRERGVEHDGAAAREQLLAQLLARDSFRQRLPFVMLGQRRDNRVLEPGVDPGRDQHVAGAPRMAAGDERVDEERRHLHRIDRGARRERGNGRPAAPASSSITTAARALPPP